jgi:uncharacterized membrane protein
MPEFLQTPTAQVILSLAVLAILVVIGVYVVLRFRGFSDEDEQSANQTYTNFREMYEQGDISEAEFRKLKTALGKQMEEELKSTGDKG